MIPNKKKMKQPLTLTWGRVAVYFGLGIITGLILLFAVARLTWHGKLYPGVSVGKSEVGGLTYEQAKRRLSSEIESYQPTLRFNGAEWEVPTGVFKFDIEKSLNEAYRYGRRLQLADYLLLLINKKTEYPLYMVEQPNEEWETWLSTIAPSIELPAVEPAVEITNKKVAVTNGTNGFSIDHERLWKLLLARAEFLDISTLEIPTVVVEQQLTREELDALQKRGEKLLGKNLTLSVDDTRIELADEKLIALLLTNGNEGVKTESIREFVEGIAESIDTEPQDARFEFAEGKVQEFAPGKDGVKVSIQPTASSIEQAIEKLLGSESKTETVQIAVTRTPPLITTDKVNEMGIRERIGRGESYYAHSIANRVYNVGLASSRANSTLIPPGSEFSFNKAVGEVSGATGYKTAYVISGGRTVLGDGGGVCQVSTTIFRAALNAGLPITERWSHAYRVGYYEQNSKPGVDATVYAPSKDLRFLNDTPGHILVQLTNDPKNLHLVVEIYGTSDGRIASVTEPKVWGVSPPPPDIVQDDPSLASGTLKQVDWAAWGAKASFDYIVTRNGETIQEKTFTSAYRPWANVYLKGTMGEVAAQ